MFGGFNGTISSKRCSMAAWDLLLNIAIISNGCVLRIDSMTSCWDVFCCRSTLWWKSCDKNELDIFDAPRATPGDSRRSVLCWQEVIRSVETVRRPQQSWRFWIILIIFSIPLWIFSYCFLRTTGIAVTFWNSHTTWSSIAFSAHKMLAV